MDIRKIKTLIEMLEASDLNEIEVTQGEESVRIRKSLGVANTISDENSIILNNNQNLSADAAIKDSKYIEGNEIKSPIVGTFYRKPSPEKEPFVNVGDIVSKGDVLCIIEAMKNMNEIKSDFSGKVVSIELDDAQPVEFGQTIIVIN
tara:strand:+ start:10698 stop:11138 length:441 start_codon:yes stop_codon:yes gene_type:complete